MLKRENGLQQYRGYLEGKRDGRRLGVLHGIIWASVGWLILLALIRNILIWRG